MHQPSQWYRIIFWSLRHLSKPWCCWGTQRQQLRADGPFESEAGHVNPDSSSKKRHGLQLYVHATSHVNCAPASRDFGCQIKWFTCDDPPCCPLIAQEWHVCKEGWRWQHIYNSTVACLCYLPYIAFLRSAADRTGSVLPWVVSRGRSYRFSLSGLIRLFDCGRKGDPIPAYFPVRNYSTPTGLILVRQTRRVQSSEATNQRIQFTRQPNYRNNKEEGCALSIQAASKKSPRIQFTWLT
jgi:hypothetical protein